mmetsp:Transcript_66344/g.185482  ORF Transcript_66344/g.185482 Transcript_66344/m.185482 type:complete len:157 (+) Transcript_66344:208-678(+)
MTLTKIALRLNQQHQRDLKVYRSAHQDYRNRFLHWFMIPAECWSFFLLCMCIAPSYFCFLIGLGLGVLSVAIATDAVIGWACFFFHIFVVATCQSTAEALGMINTIILALSTWTIAWIFQVCVGHWIWEKNEPNIANRHSVSVLSICQSVLIAWSS